MWFYICTIIIIYWLRDRRPTAIIQITVSPVVINRFFISNMENIRKECIYILSHYTVFIRKTVYPLFAKNWGPWPKIAVLAVINSHENWVRRLFIIYNQWLNDFNKKKCSKGSNREFKIADLVSTIGVNSGLNCSI